MSTCEFYIKNEDCALRLKGRCGDTPCYPMRCKSTPLPLKVGDSIYDSSASRHFIISEAKDGWYKFVQFNTEEFEKYLDISCKH